MTDWPLKLNIDTGEENVGWNPADIAADIAPGFEENPGKNEGDLPK